MPQDVIWYHLRDTSSVYKHQEPEYKIYNLESKSKIGELRSLGLNIGYIFNTLKSYIQQKAENREKLLSNHFGSLVFQQLKPSFRAEMFSQYADLVDVFLKSFGCLY